MMHGPSRVLALALLTSMLSLLLTGCDARPGANTANPQAGASANGGLRVTTLDPPNGATGVDPNQAYLAATFSEPMADGFSFTGGPPAMPETTAKPYWNANKRTCTLPVKLEPNRSYRLGLNSPSFKNFRSASGEALEPVVWTFETGPAQ